MDTNTLNKIELIEAFLEQARQHLTVLKKELADGGAAAGSPRKGKKSVLSAREVAKIKARRQKSMMRPPKEISKPKNEQKT